MKLKIEVEMPRKLAIETDLLADLIGANQVHELFKAGEIEAGQRNYEWYKRKGEAEIIINDTTPLTASEERELAEINEDLNRGLEA